MICSLDIGNEFRKGGSKMGSGCFENGKQVGKWTTYDDNGKVVKVTTMKI